MPTPRKATAHVPDRATLLAALEEAYRGPAWHGPSLRSTLQGVSAETAGWRPAEGRNTIAELVAHLAYGRHLVGQRLAALMGEDHPSFPRKLRKSWWPEVSTTEGEAGWRDELALLDECHMRFISIVERASARDLARTRGSAERPIAREILGIAFHDLYHAGQVRLVVRMWEGGAR